MKIDMKIFVLVYTLLFAVICINPSVSFAAPQDIPIVPHLLTVDNLRDVAGNGYSTRTGDHMLRGELYRSNALLLSSSDREKLASLHITRIYDLRTTAEALRKPDILPIGAKYTRINIFGDHSPNDISSLFVFTTPAQAREYLAQIDRSFVDVPSERAAFGQLLTDIAHTAGPQLFHCSSGKDRTGWAAAIIQLLLGVSEADVMHDYLLTNQYSRHSINVTARQVSHDKGAQEGQAIKVLLSVYPGALQAGIEEMHARYGTIQHYVTEGLGLDAQTIVLLRQKLTTHRV